MCILLLLRVNLVWTCHLYSASAWHAVRNLVVRDSIDLFNNGKPLRQVIQNEAQCNLMWPSIRVNEKVLPSACFRSKRCPNYTRKSTQQMAQILQVTSHLAFRNVVVVFRINLSLAHFRDRAFPDRIWYRILTHRVAWQPGTIHLWLDRRSRITWSHLAAQEMWHVKRLLSHPRKTNFHCLKPSIEIGILWSESEEVKPPSDLVLLVFDPVECSMRRSMCQQFWSPRHPQIW